MSRQDEVLAWRRTQLTNHVLRWTVTTACRFWYVTLPVLAWIFISPFLALVLAIGSGIAFHHLRARRLAELARHHEMVGGEQVYLQMQNYLTTWATTAAAVGLTQRAQDGPLGVVVAADRHLGSLQHRLNADAYGRDDQRVPELVDLTLSPLGIRHEVKVLNGQTFEQYHRAVPALMELWQVASVRVQRARPGHVWITPVSADPLATSVTLTPDSLHPAVDLSSVPLGMTEDGDVWSLPLDQTSSVFGGVPGAGKSVAINVLLANVSHRPDVQLIGIDLKGGLELGDWEPRCAAVAFDQAAALSVLDRLHLLHKARMQLLRTAGYASMANHGYSVDHPLYLVVVDEAAELFSPEGSSKEAKVLASDLLAQTSRIVRLCRATGIVVLLATQKPTADSLPTIIRDNAPAKTAFRCTTAEQAVSILGDAARSAEFAPTDIGIAEKGVAVTADADGVLRRVRSFYISEVSRRAVVAATAHLARPLGTLPSLLPADEEDEDNLLPPRPRLLKGSLS